MRLALLHVTRTRRNMIADEPEGPIATEELASGHFEQIY